MPRTRTIPAALVAMQVLALGLASGLIWALTSGPPYAAPDPAQLCRKAAADAARNSGVPEEVLLAITLVETGRADQPWPWTVTVDGVGHWLDSADSAEQMIEAALADGISNIDIGCFQLNYRWHANAFLSAEDMLDPEGNALYAATFLASHYDRTGDWASAAAAYHSTTPEYAEVYRARFEDRLAGLAADGGGPRAMQDRADVPNRFPLLIAGVAGARGSLVPAGTGGQRLIGGP